MKNVCFAIAIGILPLFSTPTFAGHFCEVTHANLKIQTYILTDAAADNDGALLGEKPTAVMVSQEGVVSLLTGSYKSLPTRTGQRLSYNLKDDAGATAQLLVSHSTMFSGGDCSRAGCDWKIVISGELFINGDSYALSCKKTFF